MSGLVQIDTTPVDTDLSVWAGTFTQIARTATELARTPFVPQSLRAVDAHGVYDPATTASNVTAAILTGRELGMNPMASLRSMAIINGTPALSALALRALLLRQGHRIWVVEATNTRAVVAGQRAGDDHVQQIAWTIDDAKTRGLAGRPTWRNMPRNMLVARATAEVARLIAADSILGVPYTTEELDDGDPDLEEMQAPKLPRLGGNGTTKRTAKRRNPPPPPAATAPPPPLPPPPEDEPPTDDQPAGPAPISDAQRRSLHAGFRDLGVTDRAERLAAVRRFIGRDDIGSANDLTRDEAGRIIDEINRLKTQPAGDRAAPDANPDPDDEPTPDNPGRPYQ